MTQNLAGVLKNSYISNKPLKHEILPCSTRCNCHEMTGPDCKVAIYYKPPTQPYAQISEIASQFTKRECATHLITSTKYRRKRNPSTKRTATKSPPRHLRRRRRHALAPALQGRRLLPSTRRAPFRPRNPSGARDHGGHRGRAGDRVLPVPLPAPQPRRRRRRLVVVPRRRPALPLAGEPSISFVEWV